MRSGTYKINGRDYYVEGGREKQGVYFLKRTVIGDQVPFKQGVLNQKKNKKYKNPRINNPRKKNSYIYIYYALDAGQ